MSRSAMVSTVCVLLAATAVRGEFIGMPAGATQWISLSGNWADPGLCPGGGGPQGGDAIGGVGSIPSPSPNYVLPCRPSGVVFALADSTPNRICSAVWSERVDSVFFQNAMVDTFTVTGPPGSEGQPVTVVARCRVTGSMAVGLHASGSYVGSAQVFLEIGSWDGNTDGNFPEQFRVVPFFQNELIIADIPFANYGAAQPVEEVDYDQTATLNRVVGQPFDVAFNLNTAGFISICGWPTSGSPPTDAQMVIATIDFDLPEGYSITSVRGWTDPSAPPPCAGDADGSGEVNFADITEVLANFGGAGPAGDADHNGAVNFADVTAVLANWQAVCG